MHVQRPPCLPSLTVPAAVAQVPSSPCLLPARRLQFYQRLREGEVTEQYLWETRLLPLLGYLSADEATAVRCGALCASSCPAHHIKGQGGPLCS